MNGSTENRSSYRRFAGRAIVWTLAGGFLLVGHAADVATAAVAAPRSLAKPVANSETADLKTDSKIEPTTIANADSNGSDPAKTTKPAAAVRAEVQPRSNAATAEEPAAASQAVSDQANQSNALLKSLIHDAQAAQTAGNLQAAAEGWTRVLKQPVNPIVKTKAHFNAGVCYSGLQDYEQAVLQFQQGLDSVTAESADEVAQALLFLGYGQLELGRSRRTPSNKPLSPADAKLREQDAMQLLTTSTQVLGRLLRRYPNFNGNDQAAFFQAEAFALLGRLDDAAGAYKQTLAFERPAFGVDAHFALANVSEKLGRYDEAVEHYETIVRMGNGLPESQRSLVAESQFRAAEVLMKVGEAQKQAGSRETAATDFAKAFDYYQTVASDRDNGRLVPAAMYGAAWSKMNLATDAGDAEPTDADASNLADAGKSRAAEAADAERWFSRLLEAFPDHKLAADAKIGRGAARRLMGDVDRAVADLSAAATPTMSSDEDASAESKIERDGRAEAARFELALAQVKREAWSEAIEAFTRLIVDYPNSAAVDRYRYELAWADKSITPARPAAALEQFAAIIEQTPNSVFATEAHFHLADAAYAREDFDLAAKMYRVVTESDLPLAVRERSRYQLGWIDYRAGRYEQAADQFDQQLTEFPDGRLATGAKFLFAEAQFHQEKHSAALQAYLVAKPAIESASDVDAKMQTLTALHGAASANEAGQSDEAIRLARPVTMGDVDPAYQADAWLQLGVAQAASGDMQSAIESWLNATPSVSVTGARARCLLARAVAEDGRTREALNQYKLVYFGFGGVQADDEVRPWQAYALYEAARLNQASCRDAEGVALRQLVAEAIEQYQRLVDHYDDSELVAEAERQLEKLRQF